MGSNGGNPILELAIVVITALLGLGTNFAAIVSNRRHAKMLKREEDEADRKAEAERERDRLIHKHERMLEYLKWAGHFRRTRGEPGNGLDIDWDA